MVCSITRVALLFITSNSCVCVLRIRLTICSLCHARGNSRPCANHLLCLSGCTSMLSDCTSMLSDCTLMLSGCTSMLQTALSADCGLQCCEGFRATSLWLKQLCGKLLHMLVRSPFTWLQPLEPGHRRTLLLSRVGQPCYGKTSCPA